MFCAVFNGQGKIDPLIRSTEVHGKGFVLNLSTISRGYFHVYNGGHYFYRYSPEFLGKNDPLNQLQKPNLSYSLLSLFECFADNYNSLANNVSEKIHKELVSATIHTDCEDGWTEEVSAEFLESLRIKRPAMYMGPRLYIWIYNKEVFLKWDNQDDPDNKWFDQGHVVVSVPHDKYLDSLKVFRGSLDVYLNVAVHNIIKVLPLFAGLKKEINKIPKLIKKDLTIT